MSENKLTEKKLEDWQEFGREVALLRAKILLLEGSDTHRRRVGQHLDTVSELVESAVREVRSEDRAREGEV